MGDHSDSNGAWSRWLFCAAKTPLRYLRLLQEDQDTGIGHALSHLYKELEQLEQQDYILGFEAKRLFEIWQHQLVDAQQAEDTFGLQLVYPKIESYSARLALWLHIVNAVLRGEKPTQVVDGDTMQKAIELAAYYLWQHRLIHTQNSPDSGLAATALKIQQFADRVGAVNASRLKSGIRALRKMSADEIRQLMLTLANAGYGEVSGEGSEMQYVPSPSSRQLQATSLPLTSDDGIDSIGNQLTARSNRGTLTNSKVQASTDKVDTIDAVTGIDLTRLEQTVEFASDQDATVDVTAEQQSAQDRASSQGYSIQVGGVCRYMGSDLRQLKGLDRLIVEAIEGTFAVVRSPGWYVSHKVPLSDLRV